MAAKRKLKTLTLEDRFAIVQEMKKGAKGKDLATKYEVDAATITRVKQRQNDIEQKFNDGCRALSSKRARAVSFEEVDIALLKWFRSIGRGQPGMSGILLEMKAQELAKQLDFDDQTSLKIDKGWIQRWKTRHQIHQVTLHGEAKSVNPMDVKQWRETVASIEAEYDKRDIYNIDECGLFWRALSNKSMAFKGETCSGGKRAKDRITVLVGASAAGERMDLLVIGKAKSPRCFRGNKLPDIDYVANNKSWMTCEIFENYVRKFDRRMKFKKRNVVIIIDNCPAHPRNIKGLTNTKIVFLPPNTTAETQPMDAGVIHILKQKYRSELSKKNLQMLDAGLSFDVDLITALRVLDKVWKDVSGMSIRNCFRHVGFSAAEKDSEICEDTVMMEVGSDSLLVFDNFLATCESAQTPVPEREEAEADSSDDESANPISTPTVKEALNALNVLEQFLSVQDDGFQQLRNLNPVNEFLMKCVTVNQVQAKITDYFHC